MKVYFRLDDDLARPDRTLRVLAQAWRIMALADGAAQAILRDSGSLLT